MMNMKLTKTCSSSSSRGVLLWLLRILLVLVACHSLFANDSDVVSAAAAAASFLTTSTSPRLHSCSFPKTLACTSPTATTTQRIRRTRSTTNLAAALKKDNDASSSSSPTTTLSTPRECVFQGMQAFRRGNVAESIQLFDLAERLSTINNNRNLTPYLWQRGISYYYANDFEKARRQFRTDVAVNPNDVEEIVWEIASQLRIQPDTFPVPDALSLPPGKQDSRRIMGTIYQLFKGLATEQDLAMAGLDPKSNNPPPRPSEEFYALFYLALYNEARGGGGESNNSNSKALHYMQQALHTPYAKANNYGIDERSDYMVAVARVHCQLRGGL